MPIVTAANDLAALLESDLMSGGAARASLGAQAQAFAWTSGMPVTLANYVSSAVTESLSFSATRIAPSGTPVAVVAADGTKPTAVTISNSTVSLKKYAGLASFNTEALLTTSGLSSAIAATMSAGVLLAFEADIKAALDAGAGASASATGGSWAKAILGGIAAVASNGGNPGIVVIPAVDYAAAVGSPGLGYAMSPQDSVVTLFGLTVVVSQSGATGKGWVLDPGSVLVVQHKDSPVVVADSFSGLSTNALRLAVEAFLGVYVTAPASVAEITVAP